MQYVLMLSDRFETNAVQAGKVDDDEFWRVVKGELPPEKLTPIITHLVTQIDGVADEDLLATVTSITLHQMETIYQVNPPDFFMENFYLIGETWMVFTYDDDADVAEEMERYDRCSQRGEVYKITRKLNKEAA